MTRHRRTEVTSITDIARIAGLSVSTVSRALTGKGTLNPETRERVREIAAEHGFRMNIAAQNLRLGRTGAIAVLLPLDYETGGRLSNPLFMAMLGYLADAISQRGYNLVLSRVVPAQGCWLKEITQSGRVDGVIVIGQSDQDAVLNHVAQTYTPMVVWGAWHTTNRYLTVGTDNVAGGRLAAEHLIAKGRTRLAFFGDPDLPEDAARYEGFRAALSPALQEAHVLIRGQATGDDAYAAVRDHLARHPTTDGVFAASDVVAMSVIRAAADSGRAVPDDLSVVGFDDMPLAAEVNPPLTTIRQDLAKGTSLLCDLLFHRMAGECCASIQLPPELVVRGSS